MQPGAGTAEHSASEASDASLSDAATEASTNATNVGTAAHCMASNSREACGEACFEVCNGADDDCDGAIDEAESDASCDAPQAASFCLFGTCLVIDCDEGYRDCDFLHLNGCEVGPEDPAHCGRCGRACKLEHASARCQDGACVIDRCEAGYGDCDRDGRSCESRLDSAAHCGACGRACSVPNAVAGCERGECGIEACKPGFADCDGDPGNGCEQSLATLEHCGGCGQRCDKASCLGGVCTAADCSVSEGRADCDGDEVSCEVNLHADPAHCGRCDNACEFGRVESPHAVLGCTAEGCRAVCAAGYGDCDGRYANGCEQSLNTLEHCGACGESCSIEGATATCREGRCEIDECDTDRGDCDGDRRSCERALDDTGACGACDQRCALPNASAYCGGSPGERSCGIVACSAGFLDCDGLADTGCERDGRPVSEGGDGPCSPDSSCRRSSYDGRDYFVCSGARTWADARRRCRSQRGGDLLVLDDSRERDFIRARISTRHWIGHTDQASEGTWIWAATGAQFWRGGARGSAVDGRFADWARDEPNGSGDCGALFESGLLDDLECDRAQPFVCEVEVEVEAMEE